MCRLVGYIGDSRQDLEKLAEGLKKSAENDTIGNVVHGDGWGYAIHSELGISFYKTKEPIFKDSKPLPPTSGRIHAIIHARRASPDMAVKERFSHPFLAETQDSYVFLAHNGALNEKELRGVLNFEGEACDSELGLRYLVRNGFTTAVAELEKYVKENSALNLLVLQIGKDGGTEVFVNHYYRKAEKGRDKTDYYRLLRQTMSGGTAVFSSTFNKYSFSGEDLDREGLTALSSF